MCWGLGQRRRRRRRRSCSVTGCHLQQVSSAPTLRWQGPACHHPCSRELAGQLWKQGATSGGSSSSALAALSHSEEQLMQQQAASTTAGQQRLQEALQYLASSGCWG
jgi:hypothetical protein